ncbi:MAG: S41 family peptidase [Hellea sp.]|nr:S41 family peptidase [Hellea sp.]
MKTLLRFGSVYLVALMCPSLATADQKQANQATLEQLELFADAYSIVRENYIEDLTDAEIMEGAINGALESLDPHSSYVPEQAYEERQKNARREYGGLGIEVTLEDGLVKVNYVIPGGPADKQGLKRGEFITAVEGEEIFGKTLDEAVSGMRGLEGDPINVTVKAEDSTTRELTIVREVVSGRAVRHRVEDGVGYIYIETFNHPRLSVDVKAAIEDLKSNFSGTLPGLVIDVRSNPGGRVDQVVKVTDYFLDGGEVFSSRARDRQDTRRYHAQDGQLVDGVPIVVLINSQSASAAEIIAGALQDRNRALVIGRRSFGKGSVQSIIQLPGGGALRLTTERYYTPSGHSIQGLGIMPDVLVAGSPESDTIKKRFRESNLQNALSNPNTAEIEEDFSIMDFPSEEWPSDEDYQLAKAVELVKSPLYENRLAQKNVPLRLP